MNFEEMEKTERTKAWLKQAAQREGLYPGRRVYIESRVLDYRGQRVLRRRQEGEVAAVYPHWFSCRVAGRMVCCHYSEIWGEEEQKIYLL